MINFYQQPHIFVVFRPGAAGNFISNLIDNILNQNFNSLKISNSGHVHYNSIVERKRADKDYLSFGAGLSGTDPNFFTEEERIKYYKDGIDGGDYLNQTYVTWTHAFYNIPIYRSLFPNSKILVINDDSLKERLISMVMHVNKNHFSRDDQSPFPFRNRIKPKIFKAMAVKDMFSKSYPGKKYVKGYADLDLSMMYKTFLKIQGLEKYLDQNLETIVPYHDDNTNTLLTIAERKAEFSVGRQHAAQSDISIDFNNILTKSLTPIVGAFETVFSRTLSTTEIEYVKSALNEYVESQNHDLIKNPIEYINGIKEKADTIVSAF